MNGTSYTVDKGFVSRIAIHKSSNILKYLMDPLLDTWSTFQSQKFSRCLRAKNAELEL